MRMVESVGGLALAFLVVQVGGLLGGGAHGGFSARALAANLAWSALAFALLATTYVLFVRFTP